MSGGEVVSAVASHQEMHNIYQNLVAVVRKYKQSVYYDY